MYDLQATKTATMSSREIAELTGKRHDNVKSDIRTMLTQLGGDVLTFQGIYFDSMNRQQTEYLLDRDHTECLLTGYSAKARMAVIRRWKELESGQALPLVSQHDSLEADKAHAEWLANFAGLDQSQRLMLSNNISKKHGLSAIIEPTPAATPTTKPTAAAYTPLREELHGAIVDAYNWSTDPSTWRWMTASEILAECGYASPDRSQQTIAANAVREINGNRAKRAAGRRQLAVPATYVPA